MSIFVAIQKNLGNLSSNVELDETYVFIFVAIQKNLGNYTFTVEHVQTCVSIFVAIWKNLGNITTTPKNRNLRSWPDLMMKILILIFIVMIDIHGTLHN